jgi:Cd2+/Zn2+-exporting ATPase
MSHNHHHHHDHAEDEEECKYCATHSHEHDEHEHHHHHHDDEEEHHHHHHDDEEEHHHHHHHDEEEHHHHHHHHDEGGLKGSLIKIGVAIVLLIAAVYIEHNYNLATWQLLLIYLVPYLVVGWGTIKEAIEGVMEGEAFDENFLMTIATLGALCIGFLPGAESQFTEAVFVMLFFQIGELFEGYAEGKSRESISHLMDIRPDAANVERDGQVVSVDPETVKVGETIVIRPGEKVPLDGEIIEGQTSLNTVALTGESVPREVVEGDEVISGCINISGVIKVRTSKSFGESTVSKIIELVESASDHKSKSEAFITRFARIYTPIVVYAAIALAFIPPFFCQGGFMANFSTWLYRGLMFLVVSCPCALVISVPLTFFGGIGGASRNGILIKGANFIDQLAKIKTVVFDKTGTLTEGVFAVTAVHPDQYDEKHLLHLAAHVEHFSTHPIAQALRDAYPEADHDGCSLTDIEEVAGQGIKANVNGKAVAVGNNKLMATLGIAEHQCELVGTIIHVAIDGIYAGHIVINDRVKEDAKKAIADLHELGVSKAVMLTGDHQEVAADVAQKLGLDEFHAELLPTDKVKIVERLEQEAKAAGNASDSGTGLAFVGDGINDAPVLARADVGLAMGGLGSDAAIEAADVVLMDDKPSKVALAMRIARRTLGIANQNVIFAIGVKVLVLILAAFGLATMWMAVFADVGVTVIAVLNAMRALKG